MKLGITVCAGLFVLAIVLGLAQLWFAPFSADVFAKVEMSVGALLLIACVVWFAVKEYRDDEETRSGKLDGR